MNTCITLKHLRGKERQVYSGTAAREKLTYKCDGYGVEAPSRAHQPVVFTRPLALRARVE